jgi:hypothetical protein
MVTLVTLFAAYMLSQFYRSFLAIVAPNLTQELGLGPAELGALSGVWFGTFAFAPSLARCLRRSPERSFSPRRRAS